MEELAAWRSDIVVLDLNLPDGDGLELCRTLRAQGQEVAIIMVAARSGVVDRVLGLEFGANDYCVRSPALQRRGARARDAAGTVGASADAGRGHSMM